MKFGICHFALLLSISSFVNAQEIPLKQPGILGATPGQSFYVTDPGVLPTAAIYRDIEDAALHVLQKSWKGLSSVAQEGKHFVVRYLNIADSPEIYATTNILPDDILLFQIPAFAVPPALQNTLTAESKDHPFTAQLQINVRRSSGRKYPFFQTRRIGVAEKIFVVEMPPDEESGQPLKYLQGRDIIPLTYTGGEFYNLQNDLIFEVRGQEIYKALQSLRYNSQSGDTYDFSLAIITNQQHTYIYHTEEINLDPSQIYIEKTIDGMGSPDPALVAIYANEKRLEQQLSINFFMGKMLQDSAEHKTNFQMAYQKLNAILQILNEDQTHTQQVMKAIEQEITEIEENQPSDWPERLAQLKKQLQTLAAHLAKSGEQGQELSGLLEQYEAQVTPPSSSSALMQDGRVIEVE